MTRSFTRGNVFIGATVIGSFFGKTFMRVMHISRGLPFTSALHEPQRPALQFHRMARSPACVAWRRCRTSRTTSPSSAATV